MSATTEFETEHPAAGRSLFAKLRDAWLGTRKALEEHRRLVETFTELEQLDDRMLRDIGLTRADVTIRQRRDALRRLGQ